MGWMAYITRWKKGGPSRRGEGSSKLILLLSFLVGLSLNFNLDLIFRLRQPPYFGEVAVLHATIPISASSVYGTYADDRHPNTTLEMIVNPSSTQRLKPLDYTNHLLRQKKSNRYDYNTLCPLTKEGIEGVDGHKVLDKIKRGVLRSRDFLKYQQQAIHQNRPLPFLSGDNEMATDTNLTATLTIEMNNTTARAKKSRVLCMIYTAHFPPYYDNPNLRAQAETWGAQCDGFFAASNMTDHSVGSIDLYHKGKEAYSNMWQKIRSMWEYTHDHYREEFDYFHIGGDDIYVVVENLRAYLDGPEVTRLENGYQDEFPASPWAPEMGPRPLLLGSPMPHKRKTIVIAGGPGYTLNRAAMDLLVEQLPTFLPDAVDSREDVLVGSILKISNTRDSKLYVRYGGSAEALSHFDGIGPESPKRVAAMLKLPPIPLGIDGVSEQFIAFHLKDDKEMLQENNLTIADQIYRYHAFFHDWCNNILVSKTR